MITPDYARTMARYNRWQNESLYREAAKLSDEERRRDRGAFWKSIHGTLSHLMWGDEVWMSRLADRATTFPQGVRSSEAFPDWARMCAARAALDAFVIAWAAGLSKDWLAGEFAWRSAFANAEMKRPAGLVVTHFFNHQTHHRGQVHAMLTAAGARPDDTDLPFMPD